MMTRRNLLAGFTRWLGAAMMSGLLVSPALAADESSATMAEIAHLLNFIRTSNCEFLRNGSWHAPQDAHDHIKKKLDYIRYRDTIRDAEHFIELAATRSSMSGEAYQVRCPGAPLKVCSGWLLDELVRFRKSATRSS